jgi:hypothetical protein
MHLKLTNGIPEKYSIGQLRRDNPNTSFPKNPTHELLADWNVYPLTLTDRPQVDHTQNVAEGTPALVDGVWIQVWDITDATAEEIQQRTEDQARSIRLKRDSLLSETDWIVITHTEKGMNIPLEWEVYRQALRDITGQEGFPFSVDWPIKPS